MSKIRLCQIAKAVSEVFGGLVSSFDAIHDAPEPPSIPKERIEYLDGPNYVGSYRAGLPTGRYAYVITYEGNNQRKDAGRIISVVRDANRDKPDMTSMPKTKLVYLDRDNYTLDNIGTTGGPYCYEVTYEGNPHRQDKDRTISVRRVPENDKHVVEPEIDEDDNSLYPRANMFVADFTVPSIRQDQVAQVKYTEDKSIMPTKRIGIIQFLATDSSRSPRGTVSDFMNTYAGKVMGIYTYGTQPGEHGTSTPTFNLVTRFTVPAMSDIVCEQVDESDLLKYLKKNRTSSNVVEYVKKDSL